VWLIFLEVARGDELSFEAWRELSWSERNKVAAYIRDGDAQGADRALVAIDEGGQPILAEDFARRVGEVERASALARNDRARKTWTTFIWATSGPSIAIGTLCAMSSTPCSESLLYAQVGLAGAGLIGAVPLVGTLVRRPKLAFSRDEAELLVEKMEAPPG
jgi:hypothetical protein